VAADNPIEDLLETYRLLLPAQEVTPVVFGWPERDANLEQTNAYASQAAQGHHLAGLLVTTPAWSVAEVERRVQEDGFLGLKPYLHLVIAHIGRAYCPEDVGDAFEVLRVSRRMMLDLSANPNPRVIEGALRAFGPQRLVFGSDMPITRMRMRRICEKGFYVNLVPPGLYGDVSGDPHMRELDAEEGDQLSFFLYEQLYAFRCAAEAVGLSRADIEGVSCNTAARTLAAARTGAEAWERDRFEGWRKRHGPSDRAGRRDDGHKSDRL
jgi:hypothetical protein